MSTALGQGGERLAAQYLRERGLTIVTRNWRGGGGELDLVLLDGDVLVIAEVKAYGAAVDAIAAVDETKAHRIALATEAFLRTSGLTPETIRFDLVTVDPATRTVAHYPDAFRP